MDMIPNHNSPKNWTEDYQHENGKYICHCVICDEYFFGYKRRVVCKECATLSHPTLPSDEEIKRKATEYAENENSCYTNDYYGYVNGAKDVRSIASARIAEMERELQEAKNLVRSITEFAEGMKVLDGEALQVLKNTARRVLSDKPTQFPRK